MTTKDEAIAELAARMSEMTGKTLDECMEMARQTLEMAEGLSADITHDEDAELVLIEIGEAGEDGPVSKFDPEPLVIGREGDLAFPDDGFLSPKHAKLWLEGDKVLVEDMDSFNGTYVKVDEPIMLEDGDQFLMGRQVLRFTLTKDQKQLNDECMEREGVREMASPPPLGAATLQRVGLAGAVYDSYELDDEKSNVLGRALAEDDEPEQGWADIRFSNDRFMSQRHNRVWFEDGAWKLEDLGSSNGTWSQIKAKRELSEGGHIFLGKQLFRIDRRA